MAELFGGFLKKKSMNTIPFNAKMRTLAYVMIHNLYPVTNLTTLSGPRTIFLYILPLDQEHHQEELKDNIAITESHYGFHRKDKAEDSKRSYHCVKRLSHWSSYRDPKQSPHHRIKNLHFSNPKGWCWRIRWGHEGRNWQVHLSLRGLCTAIFPSTSMRAWSSWLSHCQGWANVLC